MIGKRWLTNRQFRGDAFMTGRRSGAMKTSKLLDPPIPFAINGIENEESRRRIERAGVRGSCLLWEMREFHWTTIPMYSMPLGFVPEYPTV
jgi:hypothetical protein